MNNLYYVYVYIDPRNYEEFYYGKGIGSRKFAHLIDKNDSEKTRRIKEILDAGLTPIIRVIAKGLTEQESFLVEKTLLWKLGKWTTNESSGHFQDKFRPKDSYHEELPEFDYQNGIYYFNVGEGRTRLWEDCLKHNFISAGQGIRWRDAIMGFEPGDLLIAYLKNHGFVGVGKIKTKAKMIRDVKINGRPLLSLSMACKNMSDHCDSEDNSEYVAEVDWIKVFPKNKAIWTSKPKLYTTPLVRASLVNQKATLDYLEQAFGVSFLEQIK